MSDTDDSFNFLISMCYTQLFNLLCEKAEDVYKRQLLYSLSRVVRPAELHSRSAEKNCLNENVSSLRSVKGATPVSYTHLDVYKRQASTSFIIAKNPGRSKQVPLMPSSVKWTMFVKPCRAANSSNIAF